MKYSYQDCDFFLSRFPQTDNATLRAWSAAEEHILKYLEENDSILTPCSIYNDRFGFLSLFLKNIQPTIVINYASQQAAIEHNFRQNEQDITALYTVPVLTPYNNDTSLVLLRVPKSMEMFRLFLYKISKNTADNVTVIAGFMTKYFTPQMLKIAGEFFESVEQSRAWKKSRLLILQQKKTFLERDILHRIPFKGKEYQQYWGVFSAGHIDYATQFFLEYLQLQEGENTILDLASGNGIIAATARQQRPNAEIHLMDDSHLAIASSRLNLSDENTFHHCSYRLGNFEAEQFDVILSNPPFHFGHEIDISVPLRLFQQAAHCLKSQGRFLLVANRHLNYKTHLYQWFSSVTILAQNSKFIVYQCKK